MRLTSTNGIVAILDALGAANYTDDEITRFMESRDVVISLLEEKTSSDAVTTFTFNDTVLIVYKTPKAPTYEEVHTFCELLRRFEIYSIKEGILFRGAFSIGQFYVDDSSNTVMGQAVTDAAAWYDQADWIGISATPKASLVIDSLVAPVGRVLDNVLLDYPVPLKGGSSLPGKAINWPKSFVVKGLRPKLGGLPEHQLRVLLTRHRIPKGTESKYMNSVAFFDESMKRWRHQKKTP